MDRLPANVILVTTLETNRDDGYEKISKAPPPSERHAQFKALRHPRKIVTIEPVLDFDLEPFVDMIVGLEPEYVCVGLNSRQSQVRLLEPTEEKFDALVAELKSAGIPVKLETTFEARRRSKSQTRRAPASAPSLRRA